MTIGFCFSSINKETTTCWFDEIEPRPIGAERISLISARLIVEKRGKVGRYANVLPTFSICFWFSRDQVGGEVQPFILLNLPLVIFIWGLFYKIKQVHLHLHSWLSIGKTCYNKILCLPFSVVTTEEWRIEWGGSNPGRCFLCRCEVSGEGFQEWRGWHIIHRNTSNGHALGRLHSSNHEVQVRLFLNYKRLMQNWIWRLTNKQTLMNLSIDESITSGYVVNWKLDGDSHHLKSGLSIDNIEMIVNRQRAKCCRSTTDTLTTGLSIDSIDNVVDWQPCQCCRSTTSYLRRVLSINNIDKVVNRQPEKCCRSTTENLKTGLSIDNIYNVVDWQTYQCCRSTSNIIRHMVQMELSIPEPWPRDNQSTTRHTCVLTRARCGHTRSIRRSNSGGLVEGMHVSEIAGIN